MGGYIFVLAVIIPIGFFKPTPLDDLTLNFNLNKSPKVCYRQALVGRRLANRYIKDSKTTSTVQDCEDLCSRETSFICKGFAYRQPQSTGKVLNCDLTDQDTTTLEDNNFDFYVSAMTDFYERSGTGSKIGDYGGSVSPDYISSETCDDDPSAWTTPCLCGTGELTNLCTEGHTSCESALGICLEKLWRDDGRCGESNPLPNGTPGQCDPTANENEKGPCCSNSNDGYCGNTAAHCNCSSCINYAGTTTTNITTTTTISTTTITITTTTTESETPVTIVNNLNDQTMGKLTFKTTDLCTQKTLDYGPIPAGSKTTLKHSSICYITSVTAKPSNSQQCDAFTKSDGEIHSGPFTIHPNPKFPNCEVTDTYNEVDIPFTILNGLNVEVTGTLTFKTTEVCQQVPLVYGPLPSGKKTTIYFPSQCFFIKVEANPTKIGSKKCTAFASNDGTHADNFKIVDNIETSACQVTNE